ncbi:LacI family DNA-binding transcriptional regulator [Gracilibacillus thailandensis]|uniref:LacI family DNA-binding transcriptional regulator n=1 Tax=Gracilibacillus thailandensis TaxID=563735 RepID=A0A6N7QVS9_9BACI|nr:LacI family DNA-binding transcriptional regulator [Gracilibacillus thailandensis]MRI66118.1 LacI family DNA-binding transcriptional regulator [Gracilibacillus thailandensis]
MSYTMRDVAKEAGVSVATVSRIINGKGEASPETIAKVKKVIERLNYKPNMLAKSLSERKSNLIALLIPTLNNPFFPELVREIETEANKNGYQIYLCNSDDQRSKVEYYLDSMVNHYVSGAIINSLHVDEKDLSLLEERGIRTITIDRANFEHSYSAITVDHKAGAQDAVTYLIQDNQCKNIVFISGPKGEKSAIDRLLGYKLSLKQLESPIQTKIVYGDFGMESGYQLIRKLLKDGETFDGIFSSNDAMAIGAIRACYEFGIQIPEQVKIVGYDNINMTSYLHPRLSTVDQCKTEVGALAIKELMNLFNNGNEKPNHYELKPKLIIRESS